MSTDKNCSSISRILCPTDLSPKSQRTLGYATRISTVLGAELTAFHSAVDSWLYQGNGLLKDDIAEITSAIQAEITKARDPEEKSIYFDVIVEKKSDPAQAILRLTRELSIDLIVMKARPGVLSALHFGSIVERVVTAAGCPVMLMPSRFLADHDPAVDDLKFRRILFDYDFSQATDELFHLANALTRGYRSELHVLSVLEPPLGKEAELASSNGSCALLQDSIKRKLTAAIESEPALVPGVATTVEWGDHAEKVLRYADSHSINLICTALPRPNFYFEKFYKVYLGRLLASARCPVMVKQSV